MVSAFTFEDLRTDGDAHIGVWRVPATLPFFDGHFPGAPIVPAFIMLEVSTAFVEQAGGRGLELPLAIQRCKVKRPLVAGTAVTITASWEGPLAASQVIDVSWMADDVGDILALTMVGGS